MRELRGGFTTGACAAAAAKAAAMLLLGAGDVRHVDLKMPDGAVEKFAIETATSGEGRARAAVRKCAGDDPDVTDGAMVVVELRNNRSDEILFEAGEGVGVVTMPGLSVPAGEPAVNPGPRRMIADAILDVRPGGCVVTISIPGGRELAKKTYNPRLGIEGGLSILGTTGRVVPYSHPALRDALKCSLDVASAAGVKTPVFVPGNIGRKAAEKFFQLAPAQVVEVSNEWGWMLDHAKGRGFDALLLVGHSGKLAKLAMGHWDTHSKRSPSAVAFVRKLASDILERAVAPMATVEGIFEAMNEIERETVGDALARDISRAAADRFGGNVSPAVILINMKGEKVGLFGDVSPWQQKKELH